MPETARTQATAVAADISLIDGSRAPIANANRLLVRLSAPVPVRRKT
jgi:hypothetical protein